VTNICRKLGDAIQVVKLLMRAVVPLLLEGECWRLVVRQDGEVTGLQDVAKMSNSPVYRQELPVVCAVFLLRRTELPGEEGEGLPDILNPL
jgi:hypothetical protein